MNATNTINQAIDTSRQEKNWIEQHEERELIHYLRETINNICDRVRNKMVAPYAALQVIDSDKIPKELVDMGIKNIHWLCHVYLPSIIFSVEQRVSQLNK